MKWIKKIAIIRETEFESTKIRTKTTNRKISYRKIVQEEIKSMSRIQDFRSRKIYNIL